jgi:hypothetical protein
MPDATDLADAFARCFAGADGQRVVGYLRRITVERRTRPDIDAASLRHLEGQRWLVGHIAALIARGGGQPIPEPPTQEDPLP